MGTDALMIGEQEHAREEEIDSRKSWSDGTQIREAEPR